MHSGDFVIFSNPDSDRDAVDDLIVGDAYQIASITFGCFGSKLYRLTGYGTYFAKAFTTKQPTHSQKIEL